MNISKLTKPVLWVIMLSTCTQTLPMGGVVSKVSPQLVKKAGVAASGLMGAGASAFGLSKLQAARQAAAEVSADVLQQVPQEVVESTKNTLFQTVSSKVQDAYHYGADVVSAHPTAALALGVAGGVTALGGLTYLGYKRFCTLSPEKAEELYQKFYIDTQRVMVAINENLSQENLNTLIQLTNAFKALNIKCTEAMNNYVSGLEAYIAAKQEVMNTAPIARVQEQPAQDAPKSMLSKATSYAGNIASTVKPCFNKYTVGGAAVLATAGLGYGLYKSGYATSGYNDYMLPVYNRLESAMKPAMQKIAEKAAPLAEKAIQVAKDNPKKSIAAAVGTGLAVGGTTYAGVKGYQALKASSSKKASKEASMIATENAFANHAATLSNLAMQHWNSADELLVDLFGFEQIERDYAFGADVVELKNRMKARIVELREADRLAQEALRRQQEKARRAERKQPVVAPAPQPQVAVAPKVVVTAEVKSTTVRGVKITVEGNNFGKTLIPGKLLAALQGNANALVEAKKLANNDKNTLAAIDAFMQSDIARTIISVKPGYRVAKQAYYNRVNLSKNSIDALAKACGVKIVFA